MPQAACFEGLLAESALPFFLKSKFQGNRQEAARSFRLSSRSLRKSGPFWLSFWSLPHAIAFRFSSFLCETGGRVSVSPGHWVGGLRAERAAAAPGAEWNARRRTGRVGTGKGAVCIVQQRCRGKTESTSVGRILGQAPTCVGFGPFSRCVGFDRPRKEEQRGRDRGEREAAVDENDIPRTVGII